MYISEFCNSKIFRHLNSDSKVVALYIIVKSNSCGVFPIDLDEMEFRLNCDESIIKDSIQNLVKKEILHHDEKSEEVMVNGYLLKHNMDKYSMSQRVKFRSDLSSIKSASIKTKLDKIVEELKKIAPVKKTQIPFRPGVDK